jgi:hypothetical protein
VVLLLPALAAPIGEGGLKRAALQVYARDVLCGKGAPASHASAALAPLLQSCNGDDFAAELVPHLERLLRKNPDNVLPAVAALLAAVHTDLR